MANLGYIQYNIKVLKNIYVKTFKCTTCSYRSKSISFIENHMMKHNIISQPFNCEINNIESYLCGKCGFETIYFNDFKQHTKSTFVRTEVQSYTCKYCKFATISLQLYLLHKRNCFVKNKKVQWFKCETCTYKTKRESYLERHRFFKHNTSDTQWFNVSKYDMETHIDIHAFQDKKSQKSKNKRNLKRGVLTKLSKANDNVDYFQCESCEYRAKQRSDLKRHKLRKHTNLDQAQWLYCDTCNYKSIIRCNFIRHIKYNHSDVKYFDCTECSYKTKRKVDLENHKLLKHTNLYEAQWMYCNSCDFKTVIKDALRNHVTNKHSDVLYSCKECDYKTKHKPHLKRHRLKQHINPDTVKWIYCNTCECKFVTKYDLKLHMKLKHSDVGYFNCEECDYKTKYKCNLPKHKLMKHIDVDEAQWWYCNTCSYKSLLKSNLGRHIRNKHRPN